MKRELKRIGMILSLLLLPIMLLFFTWDVVSAGTRQAWILAPYFWKQCISNPLRVTINDIRNP